MAKQKHKIAPEFLTLEYHVGSRIEKLVQRKQDVCRSRERAIDFNTDKMTIHELQHFLLWRATGIWRHNEMDSVGTLAPLSDATKVVHKHGIPPALMECLQYALQVTQPVEYVSVEHEAKGQIVSIKPRGISTRPVGTAKKRAYDCRPQAKCG